MNTQLYLYEITRYLTTFLVQVKLENQSGHFDINKYAEGFLVTILNMVLKKEFERLEFTQANYPAVDLRSKDNEICIQITSEKGFEKVKHTLSRFVAHKLYESSKLIHLIIHEEYKTRKTDEEIKNTIDDEFTTLGVSPIPNIGFTTDNIWNIARLRREIEQHCSVEQLKQIRDLLKSQYGYVVDLPDFDDVLIPYQTAFEPQLKATTTGLPFLFSNQFFGRGEDLKTLTDFFASASSAMTIVADGGYGKTRLCVEFFTKVVDPPGDTVAFVLNERAYKGHLPIIGELLTKRVVILVDDAHKKPELLESLMGAVNQHKNVKIILTVRKALYDDTIKALPTHSRNVPSLPLKRLTYDETLALIQSQLPGLQETQRKRIAEESKGVPIVILGLCQMIREGKYSSEISEEDNFIRFVREVKDQVISDINSKYYVDKGQINKTIQLISLLGPVQNNQDEITALGKLNGLSYEDTLLILSYLEEHEFIRRKSTISILSDPYSDIILLEMAQRVKFILQHKGIDRFTDRIIRNLIAVEHSERLKLDLDSIIGEFINTIAKNKLADYADAQIFNDNLETLKNFTHKKPNLAAMAVRVVLKSTEGINDFWKPEPFSRFRDTHEHLDTIISIIALNTHGITELEEVDKLVREIIARRGDFNVLTKTFRYREFDFHEYRYNPDVPCERQQFLAERIKEILAQESVNPFDTQYVLTATALLLQLDFSITESFDARKHMFSYGTAQVIDNEVTRNLRDSAILALIALFKKNRQTDAGTKCFEMLLRKLHFLMTPDRKANYILNQSSQVDIVSKFLVELMNTDATIEEKSLLNRQLQMYSRREIKPEYKDLFKSLLDSSNASKDMQERIELAVRDEYFHKKNNLSDELKAIVSEYKDWASFYRDVVAVRKRLKEQDVHNLNDLFNFLVQNHPLQCREMYALVIAEYPELAIDFCELVRANYTDKEYFYKSIEELWALDTQAARQAAIYLLTIGRKRDRTQYEKKDFIYIETALNEGNNGAMYRLSVTLPDYIYLDPDFTLKMCATFIEKDTREHETEMLILSLFEKKDFDPATRDKVKEFAFNKTLALRINAHYHNQVLIFLETNFGFDTMFSYLVSKLEYHEKNDGLHLIDFSGFEGNPDQTQEQREDNLIKAIQWYIQVEQPSTYVHSKLLDVFALRGIFTPSFRKKLETLIGRQDRDLNYLVKICEALDVLEDKDGDLLDFLISIGNKVATLPGFTNDTMESVFGSHFTDNMGTRSKSGPGPYPQDVDRKAQLTELLKRTDLHDAVRKVFERALKIVEKAIEREINSESDDW